MDPLILLRPGERDALLLELRDNVVAVKAALEVRNESVADHEGRIRGLERWKYSIPASLFAAVLALGVNVSPHNW